MPVMIGDRRDSDALAWRVNEPVRVLLVSGSTRAGSVSTAALASAAAVAPHRLRRSCTTAWPGCPRSIPMMTATACREKWRGCGRRSPRPKRGPAVRQAHRLDHVAAPGRGQGAQDALASVLGYVGAVIVEPACRRIPVDRAAVRQDGTISDPRFKADAAQLWDALLEFLGER